ncbi:sugar transporter [Sphingobacterium phlebotomi]|uniref:Sugar transporter n=1 Tax=Sphingobacterium phlebotomi TaxID=2605433 RepID=A0A5D4H860_9SPHI|nr:polysaccharide biosynthesis/export family protein [Sphingobacterium phlebotomi]TYR36724.1 sugar transporter [Sphingobacterium phlebotomi]
MNKITLLTWLLGLVLLNGCIVPKKVVYVKDMMPDTAYMAMEMLPLRLQKNDRIQIVVSASAPELAAPFNGGLGSYRVENDGSVSTVVDRTNGGYMIDYNGNIDFPILGTLHVERLTVDEVRELIRSSLISKEYITNPTVKVELLNLRITVMGAAGNQVLNVPEGRITLLEAITQSGGLSNIADPQAVLVIREENGVRKKYVNDIESKSIFDSPTYYLRQNDIVYVEPKMAAMTPREQQTRQYISFGVSMLSLALTLYALLK